MTAQDIVTSDGAVKVARAQGFYRVLVKRARSWKEFGTVEVSDYGWYTTSALGTKYSDFNDALNEILRDHDLPEVYVEDVYLEMDDEDNA